MGHAAPLEGQPATSGAMAPGCRDHNISASAVRTRGDIRSFVECAKEYLAEHGTVEARRAFNEDARWKHGAIYVFVDGVTERPEESKTLVYPPAPSREGLIWPEVVDVFGTGLDSETYRLLEIVDAGWLYYSFPNPATGKHTAKASYISEVDWNGERAALGAGIYARDLPGTCYPDEVSAAALGADPSPQTLREFVRCAAMLLESDGYFAKEILERHARWTDGGHYLYVLDSLGNQVMSGSRFRVNGKALHEWGRAGEQFGGRDMADVGGTFGESHVYYRSHDLRTGAERPKLGFLKRAAAQGVPLLIGAGYYLGPDGVAPGPACAENEVRAAAVRTPEDVQAFVQCAAEYALEHGEEEARRAFNEDERWKTGPMYVFVDGVQPSGADAVTHVYPPDPSREGAVWGTSIDSFGSDYFYELHRVLSMVGEGWVYYAFDNPSTGRRQPKSSYVKAIDWNGERAAIGAGIYSRDLPGTCDPGEVHAAGMAANPSDRRLLEFVRCATLEVESAGFFAGPMLSASPRWKHGSVYVFGVNGETGAVEFSGNRASFATSGRIPELLFGGRDVIEVGKVFGESFWYYSFENPVTGALEPKVAFVKLARPQGFPLLVGSGYNP